MRYGRDGHETKIFEPELKQLLRHVDDSCNKFMFISNHHSSKFEAHMIRSSDVEIVLYSQDG